MRRVFPVELQTILTWDKVPYRPLLAQRNPANIVKRAIMSFKGAYRGNPPLVGEHALVFEPSHQCSILAILGHAGLSPVAPQGKFEC